MTFLIAVIAAFLLAYLFIIKPGSMPSNADSLLWKYPYAHRGLHEKDKSVPENSMSAFIKAMEAGYGIELDLALTADSKIVVFHDDNLLRVCGINKLITDCTYAELLQYRLFETDEKIPLFKEILALIDGRVPLIVEIKPSKYNEKLCKEVSRQLETYQGTYCVESFHPGIVRWFFKNRPEIVRGQLSADFCEFRGIHLLKKIMISLLLSNIVARPHFVSFKYQNVQHKLRLRLFRLMEGKLVGWTIQNKNDIDNCRRYFDTIIFEFFRP